MSAGRYDDMCTYVRLCTHADATVVLVLNGRRGSGFSFQGHPQLLELIPEMLEILAGQMRESAEAKP